MNAEPRPMVSTLPNGMTLIQVLIPESEITTVQLMVAAGSRDESRRTAGLAHYLEHMFFKGTDRRPDPEMIRAAIAVTGGFTNAYTGIEEVSYYAVAPSRFVRTIADVITDMLSHPRFDVGEMNLERGPVLREMANRQADGWTWLYDNLSRVTYGGTQPMAWTSIGFEDVIRSVGRDELAAYHRGFYDPSRMALVVCGGQILDPAEAARLVADIPRGHLPPRVPAQWGQGDDYLGKDVAARAGEPQQTKLMIGVPVSAAGATDEAATRLVAAMLSKGDASRLDSLARRRPDLIKDTGVMTTFFSDTGVMRFLVAAAPRRDAEAVEAVLGELRDLAANGPRAGELRRAVAVTAAGLFEGTERADGLARYYATAWREGRPLRTPGELAAGYEAVDAAAVQRAAQGLLRGLEKARFTFLHPADPATGLDEAGRTRRQQAEQISATIRRLSGPDRSLAA